MGNKVLGAYKVDEENQCASGGTGFLCEVVLPLLLPCVRFYVTYAPPINYILTTATTFDHALSGVEIGSKESAQYDSNYHKCTLSRPLNGQPSSVVIIP